MIIKNNTTNLLVTLSFLLILPFVQKQWFNLYSLNINDISFYSILYYLSGAICPSLVCLNSLKNYTYYDFNIDKIHSILEHCAKYKLEIKQFITVKEPKDL